MTETIEPKKAKLSPVEAELMELGLTNAATKLASDRVMVRKLKTAYEYYQVVTQEAIDKFNADLKKKTYKKHSPAEENDYTYESWKMLGLKTLESYLSVPPPDVLKKLREAKDRQCFDFYQIAEIVDQKRRRDPDPILFGGIAGSDLHFAIADWGEDVSIEEIIGKEEGWGE